MAPSFLTLLPLIAPTLAQYHLVDHRAGSNFFDGFSFFTGADPTAGFVNYVDQATASANGLIGTGDQIYIGVDYTSTLAADGSQGGRQSVRLTSNAAYTEGLFILDVQHMPGGICGTWPAWWTVGPNWPNQGEIDIIEGVNSQTNNLMSLHTSDQCSIAGSGETGSVVTGDCYEYDPNQSNSGCGITNTAPNVYGNNFNAIGGGVYAMEWTSSAIKVWFFPRQNIPGDISSSAPNPAGWGTPAANFAGNCDIGNHFANHNIVFDTTFCGQWAGAVFSSDATCGSKNGGNCQAYVAGNPGDFKNAFWSINYMSVYQSPGEGNGGLGSYSVEEPASDFATNATMAAPADPAAVSSIANNGMGASTAVPVPGVTPPAKVAPAKLNQVPATANTTDPVAKRAATMLA